MADIWGLNCPVTRVWASFSVGLKLRQRFNHANVTQVRPTDALIPVAILANPYDWLEIIRQRITSRGWYALICLYCKLSHYRSFVTVYRRNHPILSCSLTARATQSAHSLTQHKQTFSWESSTQLLNGASLWICPLAVLSYDAHPSLLHVQLDSFWSTHFSIIMYYEVYSNFFFFF